MKSDKENIINEKEIRAVAEFNHKNQIVFCIAICPVLVFYN